MLKSYVANGWWLCGVLLDIGGALMTMVSLSLAPVSVVQPVLGCGLAFVAIFSVSYVLLACRGVVLRATAAPACSSSVLLDAMVNVSPHA